MAEVIQHDELAKACAAVSATPAVQRFDVLERQAYALGRAVAAGEIEERAVLDALLSAAELAGTPSELRARKSGQRALDRGKKRATASHLRLVVPSNLPPDGRPTIRIGTDLMRVGDEAAAALARDAEIYQRKGRLVRVVRVASTEAQTQSDVPVGTPEIREVPLVTLRERLAAVARWEKYDGRSEDFREAPPPEDIVAAVAVRGTWRGVRPLVSLSEAPFFRPDGTICQRAGYDAATGCVYLPGDDFLAVSEAPTQGDAMRALKDLCEVFCDFPFSSDAGRFVPISAILTMLARAAIVGAVPLHLFDASTPGAGKSRITDAIALIVTGRKSPRISWPEKPEELEKILFAAAVAGRTIFGIDNIDRPLCGAPLDAALTGDEIEGRYLGRTELAILPWRAVVLATGNNVAVKGDTQRRTVVARLEPREERPEDRTDFRHPELLDWVRAHRTRLVCAALTILRGYSAAGAPDQGLRAWGSFEAWCRWVPSAIVWAGGRSVLDARLAAIGDVDPERAALSALVRQWPRLDVDGRGLSLRDAISHLYPADRGERGGRTGGPPDGFDDLRDALEVFCPCKAGLPPDAQKLSYAFRKYRGRWVAGGALDAVPGGTGSMRWRIVTQVAPIAQGVDQR